MLNPLNFISKFIKSGNKKELDRISKIVDQINLLEENIKKLNDKDIEKKFNPTSINYISRSLDVPRETIRRNILTLVDNSELIRSDEGLFVSEKWIKKNIDKIISEVIDLIDKSNDLTKKIDRKS